MVVLLKCFCVCVCVKRFSQQLTTDRSTIRLFKRPDPSSEANLDLQNLEAKGNEHNFAFLLLVADKGQQRET